MKPEASSLENMKQKADETLKQYLARFNIEAARARGMDDSSHLMAIRAGILPASPLWDIPWPSSLEGSTCSKLRRSKVVVKKPRHCISLGG